MQPKTYQTFKRHCVIKPRLNYRKPLPTAALKFDVLKVIAEAYDNDKTYQL